MAADQRLLRLLMQRIDTNHPISGLLASLKPTSLQIQKCQPDHRSDGEVAEIRGPLARPVLKRFSAGRIARQKVVLVDRENLGDFVRIF